MGFTECLVLVAGVVGTCLWTVYDASRDGRMDWRDATLAHVTESPLASADVLLYVRLACGAVNWAICAFLLLSKDPLDIQIGKRTVRLVGITRFTTFTVWCWTVMGVYYALATAMSAVRVYAIGDVRAHVHEDSVFPHWLLCATWVLYELSFAMSILVTTVVTFILIPVAKRSGISVDNMFRWPPLIMHNANVVFMGLELFLNGMRFVAYHVVFVLLFGCAYVVFAWYWHARSGIYYYFFLDPQLRYAALSYLALMLAVAAFFFLGDLVSTMLKPRVEF